MRGKVNYPGLDLHGQIVEIVGEDVETLPDVPCWLVKHPLPPGPYGHDGDLIGLPKDRVRVLADEFAGAAA